MLYSRARCLRSGVLCSISPSGNHLPVRELDHESSLVCHAEVSDSALSHGSNDGHREPVNCLPEGARVLFALECLSRRLLFFCRFHRYFGVQSEILGAEPVSARKGFQPSVRLVFYEMDLAKRRPSLVIRKPRAGLCMNPFLSLRGPRFSSESSTRLFSDASSTCK